MARKLVMASKSFKNGFLDEKVVLFYRALGPTVVAGDRRLYLSKTDPDQWPKREIQRPSRLIG